MIIFRFYLSKEAAEADVPNCYASAEPPNKEEGIISQMSVEDFTAFLGGVKKLDRRLGLSAFKRATLKALTRSMIQMELILKWLIKMVKCSILIDVRNINI